MKDYKHEGSPLWFPRRGKARRYDANCLNRDLHDLRIGRMFMQSNHVHQANQANHGSDKRGQGAGAIVAIVETQCIASLQHPTPTTSPVETLRTTSLQSPSTPPYAVIAGLTRNPVVFGGLRVVARNDGMGHPRSLSFPTKGAWAGVSNAPRRRREDIASSLETRRSNDNATNHVHHLNHIKITVQTIS